MLKSSLEFQCSKWIDESTLLTQEMFDKIKIKPIIATDFGNGSDNSVSVCMKKLNGIIHISEMKELITYSNKIPLKDGRTALSCGFGFHYAINDGKGNITPVEKSYYNKVLRNRI